jgi:hypothetical protein
MTVLKDYPEKKHLTWTEEGPQTLNNE